MHTQMLLLFLTCLCAGAAPAQITEGIRRAIQGKQATVGVAVLLDGQAFTVNNDEEYPLMSVFKFPVAVAALKEMEARGIALDSALCLEPGQMRPGTYSPLRDKYPGQRIRTTYWELIAYAVSHSDNNACDLLIGFAGGIGQVERCIRSLGIGGIRLVVTEDDMHRDIRNSYLNHATPLAVARMLEKVYAGGILCGSHFRFLEEAMLRTSSGTDKLRAGLPPSVPLGHKTGHSDRTPDGLQISENDAGVIYLPGGRKCFIAVSIRDSRETDETNARIMADISRSVYGSIGMAAATEQDGSGNPKECLKNPEQTCVLYHELCTFAPDTDKR